MSIGRRVMLLLASALIVVAIAAVTASLAFANTQSDNNNHDWNWWDNNWWDHNRHDNNNNHLFDFNQDNEQEADSGDVNQSFDVTGGGDNSNQCVGIQGVANTGNAQNQIKVSQFDDNNRGDHDWNWWNWDQNGNGNNNDFSFEDVTSSIEVNPVNDTSCDQQVNQAATAFGG